jgi:hypothetical protein
MKRLFTFVITMLLGASLAFAQGTGTPANLKKDADAQTTGNKPQKTKPHKGGKKSKKSGKTTTTTTTTTTPK